MKEYNINFTKEISQLSQQLDEINESNQHYLNTIDSLKSHSTKLEQELLKTSKFQNDSKDNYSKKVESLQSLLTSANEDCQEKEEEISNLSDKLADISSELKLMSCLKQENAVLKTQTKELRAKILKFETSEVSLKKSLKEKETMISSLISKLSSEENMIEEELLDADVSQEYSTTPQKQDNRRKHRNYMVEDEPELGDSFEEFGRQFYSKEELTSRKTLPNKVHLCPY